jgi:hypothetical protein
MSQDIECREALSRNLGLGQHDGGMDIPPEGWHRPYLENCTVDASIFFIED